MEYALKIVPEKNGCRYLLCDTNGNYFLLSKLSYEILSRYRQNATYKSIATELKKEYSNLSERTIEDTINSIFSAISKNKKIKYLLPFFKIFKPGQGTFLYKSLNWLFNPIILPIFLIIACTTSFSFYFTNPHNIIHIEQFSLIEIPLYYGLLLLILLFHELGHATAAYHYGIRPKEIGFGLYLIFPVFFTNVSGIWELNILKRTIVNIGGIYFQLLVNILLVLLIVADIFVVISQKLFLINCCSILICLIPFLRYDGYWIVSDLCKIPNLRKKAHDLMVQIISRPSVIKNYISQSKVSPYLIIYMILYIIFWTLVYLLLNHLIVGYMASILKEYSSNDPHSAIVKAEDLLILFCMSAFVSLTFYRFLKSLYHEKKKLLA